MNRDGSWHELEPLIGRRQLTGNQHLAVRSRDHGKSRNRSADRNEVSPQTNKRYGNLLGPASVLVLTVTVLISAAADKAHLITS